MNGIVSLICYVRRDYISRQSHDFVTFVFASFFFRVFSFSILIFWQFEFAIFVLWGTQGGTALTSAGKKCKCSDKIIYLKFWIFINIFFLFVSLHSEWDHRQRHVPVPQPVVARPLRQSPATRKSCHFLTSSMDPGAGPGAGPDGRRGLKRDDCCQRLNTVGRVCSKPQGFASSPAWRRHSSDFF